MQANKIIDAGSAVIVRAWGDEPVKLYLYKIENKRVFVGSENCKSPIGIPLEQVFPFDLDAFDHLCTAFQQDGGKMGEHWANIGMDDFSCNTYQDNLYYKHDQESLGSSGSTQECVSR
jgi:hypothetical protein